MRARLVLAAVAAIVLVGCHTLPTEPHTMMLLDTNPWAMQQPTATGRTIATVEYVDGRVYVGYGDANANTGPIAVTAWNTVSDEWEYHYDAATEWIIEYAEIDGDIWAPYADATVYADYGRGVPWDEYRAGPGSREAFYHVWDLLEHDGDVYAIGTQRKTGYPMVKRYDGTTWHEDFVIPVQSDLLYAVEVDGDLRIQTRSQGDWRRDHTTGTWVPDTKVLGSDYARDARAFGGRVIAKGWYTDPRIYDSAAEFGVAFLDARDLTTGDDECSYALRVDSIERLCSEGGDWEQVTTAVPPDATAVDVAGGYAFVGTADSELWAVKLP